MNSIQFIGALNIGLVYSFVAFGVYLSFRTLQFPDMTVDGSFPLGAAVYAVLIVAGYNPALATGAAFLAGSFAGLVTALMVTRLKILNLLTGIISMTALYSVNLRIMGAPNIALTNDADNPAGLFWVQEQIKHLLSSIFPALIQGGLVDDYLLFMVLAGLVLMTLFGLYALLSSHFGLGLRATGSNPTMARAQGVSDERMVLFGLALSNGFVALGGSLFAQTNHFADVSLGFGSIIIGLAAVIIGETILSPRTIVRALAGVVLGTLIYRLIVALALNGSYLGLRASDLNLVTASLVALAMALPHLKTKLAAKTSNQSKIFAQGDKK